jgi:CubicO group peptidase (beta-lactamase class C family)
MTRLPYWTAIAAALLLAAGAARADEDAKVPDTPAGRQLAGWLRAYNSGQVQEARRFIREHYARSAQQGKGEAARQLEGFNRLYGDNGPLTLVRVEKATDEEVVAVLRSPLTEAWLRLTLRVEPKPPHGIATSRVLFTDSPADPSAPGKLSDAEIARQMEAYLDRLAGAGLFSGSVLLARDGKPFSARAYGLASKAYGVPNRLDTKFNLGSMNKMFTAVAIAQLAQQGKLAFTDPLVKHLPDYPNKAVAEKVTIHQLLTHTSGIGDYFNDKYMEASKDRFRAVSDYFPLFVDRPLAFEPGQRFQYSNAGFMVLGAVVERVSGQDYFAYVREHVYRPAGMLGTDAYEMDHDTPNLAIGYTREVAESGRLGEARKNNLYLHVVKGGPAGGGFSTVEDLLRFDQALRSHRLLNARHTELVLTGKVSVRGGGKYAYGFIDRTEQGLRVVGHGGGFPGINSDLGMYLDNGYTVAVMSNYDPPAAQRVSQKFQRLLARQ